MPTSSSSIISTYLKNGIINHLFRDITLTSSSNLWLALYTSDPTDENTGTEISGSGYARGSIFSNTLEIIYPVSGSSFSIAPVTVGIDVVLNSSSELYIAENRYYPFIPGNVSNFNTWGSVTHWGLLNQETTGSLLFYGAIGTGSGITRWGESFHIMAENLNISLGQGAYSNALSGSLLNHILNGISYPSGSVVYAGLFYFLYSPIEISASAGYGRAEILAADWVAPTNGSTVNSASLVFSENALVDWGNVVGVGIFTTETGGSPIFYQGTENKTVYQGDTFSIPVGGLEVIIE